MKATLGVLALAVAMAGCVTTTAFRAGERAERIQDWDQAVLEYSKAVQENPDNVHYRKSLERARLRASDQHARNARRFLARRLYKEALEEFRLALDMNPEALALAEEAREAEERLRTGMPGPSLSDLKEQARERPLGGLALGPGAEEPLGLAFRQASLREAYLALGKTGGVNFVFDPGFQDKPITLDLEDVPFEQALTALASVGRSFHRVVDSKIIMVVPDTPAKRREYEQQVVKTFFLSNANLKETIDLLRIVLGARRVAPLPGANALTINDTPEKVAAAERIVEMVDKRRAEVLVEVEMLQVNRSLLKEYGIEFTSAIPGVDGIFGGIAPDPDETFTLDDNPYARSNLVVAGLPGVLYRLLQSDNDTRLLANPQLRTSEGQTATARFGDQVPVPVTVFTPIAQGGLANQPVTSFEYKDVGVNIDITPRVHHDGDVTLELALEISQVGPAGFQGLPTFQSRTVSTVLRLRDGETSILAGLISDQERIALQGTPGLSSIPFLGRLFSTNKIESIETDIVMTLTPHVLARPSVSLEDLGSFELGGETSPLLFEIPSAVPAATPQRLAPSRPQPIRPPAPAPSPPPTTQGLAQPSRPQPIRPPGPAPSPSPTPES
jgi:general secretion pathway protein D